MGWIIHRRSGVQQSQGASETLQVSGIVDELFWTDSACVLLRLVLLYCIRTSTSSVAEFFPVVFLAEMV